MRDRPLILCLDDEPYVLNGLHRQLRTSYDVVTTTEPTEALELLADHEKDPVAVILSDMRMPQMSGVAVLEKAHQISPETTRVLLTGDADVRGAVAAINRGQVFRFLVKPCSPEDLKATVDAAAEQYRLVRAERELLEDTLKGCVDALMDTLAMAQPAIFGRAVRQRNLAERVCAKLRVANAWQVEIAAQMGEIGAVTLPPLAIAILERGAPGSAVEAEMLARLPELADNVLARIPRLEAVREIVRHQQPTGRNPVTPLPPEASQGARILQAVREYDALVWRGMAPELAVETLSSRKVHSPGVVSALAAVGGVQLSATAVRDIDADELRVGDELADDLHCGNGSLLMERGHVITERLLVWIRNHKATTGLQEPVSIIDR